MTELSGNGRAADIPALGNDGTDFVDLGPYEIHDLTSPSIIAIAPTPDYSPAGDSLVVQVTASEAIFDFDESDLIISVAGSVTYSGLEVAGAASNYTVTFQGLQGEGTLSMSVDLTSDVSDDAGNPLEATVSMVDLAHYDYAIAGVHYVRAGNGQPVPPFDSWQTRRLRSTM